MSLLQGVLRTQTLDNLDKQLGFAGDSASGRNTPVNDRDDSEDELVNVVSAPGTPAQNSRPQSPAPGASLRRPIVPSQLATKSSADVLRIFPTDVSQRIFTSLSIKDLASCSLVSKKWNRSQTLNYVWFQHYRKENFHDESLPPGKWTKRESKQNWRVTYLQTLATRSPPLGPLKGSNTASPSLSGYQTPREAREEKWRLEAETTDRPSKVEMREAYKELGGRKARNKNKVGAAIGGRDKGGWAGAVED